MCGVFLGASCATRSSDKLNWTIDIPAKEELAPIDWKNLLDQVMPENAEVAASDFKVVQITDIHFDPYFSPGTRTDCGEPVCCRNVNGPARTLASMAGIWGDYTDCDTPYFTVDSALKRVTSEHPDVCVTLFQAFATLLSARPCLDVPIRRRSRSMPAPRLFPGLTLVTHSCPQCVALPRTHCFHLAPLHRPRTG